MNHLIQDRPRPPVTNALAYQAMLDSSPMGSVGAPSGVMPDTRIPEKRDPAGGLLGLASMLPGAGDFIGPAADIRNFMVNPESRTLTNAGLFALGALPAIPSLAYLMNQGGNLANPALRYAAAKGQSGIIGYHGSPHKFDKFDLGKIGTGEGAQAYGHGLYFAESPGVAKGYRDSLSDLTILHNGNPVGSFDKDPAANAAHQIRATGGDIGKAKKRAALLYSGKWKDDVLSEIDRLGPGDVSEQVAGNLYHVDIPDEHIPNMLDWDGILSEQPQAIQDLAKMWGMKGNGGDVYGRDVLKEAEKRFGGPRGASEALRNQGVPGVRYFDAGSRGQNGYDGGGTRNFVLFDDSIPKILKRE